MDEIPRTFITRALMASVFKRMQPLIVWGISDLYFILAVTVTILFGVLAPDLQKQLHITSAQLGFLGFAFFISFGFTQLLAGSLIDSWGPRITLTVAAVIAATGLLLLSNASGFHDAFLAQVITGAGFSISYVGTIYLASMWFSQKSFSLVAGVTLMSSNIISASLIVIMSLTGVLTVDFRLITAIFAMVALVMAFLLFLIVRKTPDSNQKKQGVVEKSIFWKDFSKLLHIPQFWLGAIYFCTTISVYLAFSSLWNIPDSLAYGHELKTASLMSATLRYGCAVGAVLSGILVSCIGGYSKIIRCYSSGALLMGILLIYGPFLPVSAVFLLFALLGFFFGGAAMGFPIVGLYIPPNLKGTGFGLMAALGYLLCALLQYAIGLILSYQVPKDAAPSVNAFTIALTPLIIVLAIAWICSFWLLDRQKA